MVVIQQLFLWMFSESRSLTFSHVLGSTTLFVKMLFLCFRPVALFGPMSAGALTTALVYVPESMQALSSPEQLPLLFRVGIIFVKEYVTAPVTSLLMHICFFVFILLYISLRMWNLHGYSDRSGWLKFDLPLAWSSGFSYQHSSEVLHWTRTNTGVQDRKWINKDFFFICYVSWCLNIGLKVENNKNGYWPN